MRADAPATAELERRIRALGPWFHNLELAGVQSAPDHFLGDYPRCKFERFAHALPTDLRGCSVLDVGCNAGFYCFEMKRRGADRVVGMDLDERYLAQARLAAEVLGMDIELRRGSVYEVAELREKFDLVIFMGVLYHLRHPLFALDLLHQHVVRDRLLFQSMQRGATSIVEVAEDLAFSETEIFDHEGYPRLHFVEHRYAGDPTNWWIPNRACVEALLRSSGFTIEAHPESEVYLCRRANGHSGSAPQLTAARP
jgi:tRNA (mo5U34)-methyltransferase